MLTNKCSDFIDGNLSFRDQRRKSLKNMPHPSPRSPVEHSHRQLSSFLPQRVESSRRISSLPTCISVGGKPCRSAKSGEMSGLAGPDVSGIVGNIVRATIPVENRIHLPARKWIYRKRLNPSKAKGGRGRPGEVLRHPVS